LSSIDEKLKSQGFEPSKVEAPPTANQAPQQEAVKKVELGAKVPVEKGPLFLTPTEIPAQAKASSTGAAANPENNPESSEKLQVSEERTEFPRTLVKGPTEPQPIAKIAEPKRPVSGQEDESKGVFDQLKGDMENVSKALNPFRW
jgi:hypothetical protein